MLKELTGKITHPAFRRRKHVALLVETSLESGRDILRGIARYAREEQRWVLFHEPRSLEESIPQWLRKWDGDGVIARVQNAGIAEAIREAGIHAVDVLGVVSNTGIPLVHVDDREIARMASEHLVERGFNYFGYFGINDENWSVRRKEFFENHLSELGYKVMMFETPRHRKKSDSWEQYRNRIIDWIMRLPKPVGVMVCSDQRGMDLLEACRQAGVAVPDEVAVIGVDNDEVLCEIAYPPLSSIWPAHNQVGYEAAALLERLMNGESRPSRPILISPSGVVTRRSTDVLAVEDRN
ncbi:MAG: XylR family transcriptional regulator, partial [Verrucomicrobia bacterium]|nr:XylR family transcriptional regulator [Verrucomicrobiota bacterium]